LNFVEGFPLGSFGFFLPLNVVPIAMKKYTIKEKMGILPSVGHGESCERVCHDFVITPFWFQFALIILFINFILGSML